MRLSKLKVSLRIPPLIKEKHLLDEVSHSFISSLGLAGCLHSDQALTNKNMGLCLYMVIWGLEYCICLITIKGRQHEHEQWNMVGARIKILWEEQLFNPPNEYIHFGSLLRFTHLQFNFILKVS